MKIIEVTGIGADVEVFVQNKSTSEIVSAEGYVKGTKDEPFVFDETNKYFATSLDNILAEFCIPPAKNKVEFFNFLRKSQGYINKHLPKGLCTVATPAAILDDIYLQTEQARVFGCEPDFNAYTKQENVRPFADNPNLRSAGGHLHIGYKNAPQYDPEGYYEPDEERCTIIRALDLHIGIPSVIIEPDNQRKELYGKAGAFRPKSYGVEYRTVSNFYLASKKLTMWVYDAATAAINWLNEGNTIDKTLGEHIAKTINSNDKAEAELLMKEFHLKAA